MRSRGRRILGPTWCGDVGSLSEGGEINSCSLEKFHVRGIGVRLLPVEMIDAFDSGRLIERQRAAFRLNEAAIPCTLLGSINGLTEPISISVETPTGYPRPRSRSRGARRIDRDTRFMVPLSGVPNLSAVIRIGDRLGFLVRRQRLHMGRIVGRVEDAADIGTAGPVETSVEPSGSGIPCGT